MASKKKEDFTDELNTFVNSYPLFSGEMRIRAEWNSSIGTVEIREV